MPAATPNAREIATARTLWLSHRDQEARTIMELDSDTATEEIMMFGAFDCVCGFEQPLAIAKDEGMSSAWECGFDDTAQSPAWEHEVLVELVRILVRPAGDHDKECPR